MSGPDDGDHRPPPFDDRARRRVLVLDHGRVMERGTHDDLVATNEVYREIWEHGQMERAVGGARGRVVMRVWQPGSSLARQAGPHGAGLVGNGSSQREEKMIRWLISVAFALAVATSAEAMSPAPLHEPDTMITQIRKARQARPVRTPTKYESTVSASLVPRMSPDRNTCVFGGMKAFALSTMGRSRLGEDLSPVRATSLVRPALETVTGAGLRARMA